MKTTTVEKVSIYALIMIIILSVCYGCSDTHSLANDPVTVSTTTCNPTTTAVPSTSITASTTISEPSDEQLVLIRTYIPDISVDLKYAADDNFTHTVIYDFTEPSLRYGTVKKLAAVQNELRPLGYRLKIWDAYRPFYAHQALWNICPDPAYVSDPASGNLSHCRGSAVDVTLVYTDGSPVAMPTGFDDFTPAADRDYSDVPADCARNAQLLQGIMEEHGFKGYFGEWWHYSDTTAYPVIY